MNFEPVEKSYSADNPYRDPAYGLALSGKEMFFGREAEKQAFLDYICTTNAGEKKFIPGSAVIIYGQKQSGKTSLVNQIKNYIKDDASLSDKAIFLDFIHILSDIGGVQQLDLFQRTFYAAIMSRFKHEVKRCHPDVAQMLRENDIQIPNLLRSDYRDTWPAVFDAFFRNFYNVDQGKHVILLFIDGFAELCTAILTEIQKSPEKAYLNNILNFIKTFSQYGFIQIIVGVGNEAMMRALNTLGVLNHTAEFAKSIELSALDDDAARALVISPMRDRFGYNVYDSELGKQAVERLLDLSGRNPAYLMKLCDRMFTYFTDPQKCPGTQLLLSDVNAMVREYTGELLLSDFDILLMEGGNDTGAEKNKTYRYLKTAALLSLSSYDKRTADSGEINRVLSRDFDYTSDQIEKTRNILEARHVISVTSGGRVKINTGLFSEFIYQKNGLGAISSAMRDAKSKKERRIAMAPETVFIGREEELNRLRREVFFVEPGSYGYCYSLIGLNGIGKTTLIRKLTEEFKANRPKNTFCFSTEIMKNVSFWLYWTMLVLKFSRSITEEVLAQAASVAEYDYSEDILEVYDFFQENKTCTNTFEFRSQAIIYLSELFSYYSEMGIRIIITIDEFDRAAKVFKDGQFFQFLFSLAPKGSLTALNLSIITISRRRVCTIAHDMQEGSYFEDAYPALALKGFNNSELADYFNLYEQLPCGPLSEDVQKQILYLCGRSPGLLMGFHREIEAMGSHEIDVGYLYAEHGQFIKTAYNRTIEVLNEAIVDRASKKPLLDVFIQKFIGPVYDDNFDTELPMLYDHGVVTKGTAQSNIFLMSGIQLTDRDNFADNMEVYEPITPYFVEYIKNMVIPNDLSTLSNLLIKGEKLVREVIEKEMRKRFPDTWEDNINRYAGKKNYYLETLQVKALKNDFSARSISKLNVISFKEYYYIISDYWDSFAKYFRSYPSKNALFATMSLLSESRNDSAHLNLVIYNGESRRKLRDACSAFIACLEKGPEPEENLNIPTDAQIAKLLDEQATVTFCCQTIKMPKGNLRGIIKEYGYPAGVAQRQLEAFAFSAPAQVGDEFCAVIERWDAHAQMFNLRAPDDSAADDLT